MITQDYLRKLLNYDPDTGVFTWLVSGRGIASKGCVAGSRGKNGYIYINHNRKMYLAHRLAWMYTHGAFPLDQLDHIDGERDNNALENLRPATNMENHQNRRIPQANNTTGFIGVSYHKAARKFTAKIILNGNTKYLGLFETAQEASSAYIKAKRELHEFCTI